jgi:hypothetical protein
MSDAWTEEFGQPKESGWYGVRLATPGRPMLPYYWDGKTWLTDKGSQEEVTMPILHTSTRGFAEKQDATNWVAAQRALLTEKAGPAKPRRSRRRPNVPPRPEPGTVRENADSDRSKNWKQWHAWILRRPLSSPSPSPQSPLNNRLPRPRKLSKRPKCRHSSPTSASSCWRAS